MFENNDAIMLNFIIRNKIAKLTREKWHNDRAEQFKWKW